MGVGENVGVEVAVGSIVGVAVAVDAGVGERVLSGVPGVGEPADGASGVVIAFATSVPHLAAAVLILSVQLTSHVATAEISLTIRVSRTIWVRISSCFS